MSEDANKGKRKQQSKNVYKYSKNNMNNLTKEFITALNKCQNKPNIVLKNKSVKLELRNGSTKKYNYADLSSCMEHFSEVFAPNGFSVSQCINGESVTTILMHESGGYLASETPLYNDNGQNRSQGLGSAITYARRYALCAICGIVADEDDDGELTAKAEQKQAAKKQSEFDEWIQKVDKVKTPKECEDLMKEAGNLSEPMKRQIWEHLKRRLPKIGVKYTIHTGFIYAEVQ